MEIWKKHPLEGHLEVSNYGKVRIIKTMAKKTTYLGGKGKYIRIKVEGAREKTRMYQVHRLVGMLFVEGRDLINSQINHIDGNKYNNHFSNLEWCTQEHNLSEQKRLGLWGKPKKKK